MDEATFKLLKRGDIIRHVSGGESFLVDSNYGEYVIASNVKHISNPPEWELVLATKYMEVGFQVSSRAAGPSPPKSKFMEEWEEYLNNIEENVPGLAKWVKKLIELIDKYKVDK